MEYNSRGPEAVDPEVTPTETALLCESAAELLIRKGYHDSIPELNGSPEHPEPIEFSLDVPSSLIDELFFETDQFLEVAETGHTFSYITPYVYDLEHPNLVESAVHLHVVGRLRDTDITAFMDLYLRRDETSQGLAKGEVDYEYVKDGRVITEPFVETATMIYMLQPSPRAFRRSDAERLRRLMLRLS